MKARTLRHLLLSSAALVPFCAFADTELPKVGVVGAEKQTLEAAAAQGTKRVLKAGDSVFFKERITTDAKGTSQIIFIDKSTLTVGPNSDITVDEFVFDPKASTGKLVLSGTKGVFRFVGGALSKKQPVTIKTPVATIGVRGGIADVSMNAETGTADAALVFGNSLTVTNDQGTMTTTQIGTQISVPTNGAPMPPVPYQPQTIASTVNVNPPATGGANTGGEGGPNGGGRPENGGGAGPTNEANGGGNPPPQSPGADGQANNGGPGSPPPPPVPTNDVTQNSAAVQQGNAQTIVQTFNDQGIDPNSVPGVNPAVITQYNNTNPIPLTGRAIDYGWGGSYLDDMVGYRQGGRLAFRTTDYDELNFVFDNYNFAGGLQPTRNFLLSGSPFTARFFNSPTGAMNYYVISDNHPDLMTRKTLHGVVGTKLAASALPNAGVSFYKFLPDFSYDYGYDSLNPNDDLGFDSSLAAIGMLPQQIAATYAGKQAPYGLAIDWQQNRIHGGGILWSYQTDTVNESGILAIRGKVDRSTLSMVPLVMGSYGMSFSSTNTAGMSDFDADYSNVDVSGDLMYGVNSTRVLDGFVMTGVDHDIYPLQDSYDINQAAVRVTDPQLVPQPAPQLNVQRGFAAGVIGTYNSSTDEYDSYSTVMNDWDAGNSQYGVSVTAGIPNRTVEATMKLKKVGTINTSSVMGGGGTEYVEAHFGNLTNTDDSYLVSDRTFIADQDIYTNQFVDTTGSSSFPNVQGVMAAMPDTSAVTDSIVNNTSLYGDLGNLQQVQSAMKCSKCQFTTWGVWAGNMAGTHNGSVPIEQVAMLIPFVVGAPTQNLGSVALTGNITYSGQVIGHQQNVVGGVTQSTVARAGYFSSVINMGTPDKRLNKLDIRFADERFGMNKGAAGPTFPNTGVANLNGVVLKKLDAAGAETVVNGKINGIANMALFGPQANNLGGNFTAAVNNSDNSQVQKIMTGVFRGGR
ncbi:hypothetical protein GC177_05990 [bacterium]|nr:hypothetical protein [bacterium]